MSPSRQMMSFELDQDLVERLQEVKERDGMFVSEQLRRAVRMWLENKGMAAPAERRAPKKSPYRRRK